MLNTIDTFLRETKILRIPAALLAGYVFMKVFCFLMTIAAILDGAY